MSKESLEWLHENVRANRNLRRMWWDDGSDAASAALFDGPVPLPEVRKLFSWEPVAGALTTMVEVDGERIPIVDNDFKVIVRPDTQQVMGVFKSGYQIHGYDKWLTETIANLLDTSQNDLGVASAGLLKKGAVAWMTVEVPEDREVAGVKFRPFITAATSCDGSLASTYNRGVSLPICDNTLSAALNDRSAKAIKFKHTSGSPGKLTDVRAALELLDFTADKFGAQVETLVNTPFSEKQFGKLLDLAVPLPEIKKTKGGGPGQSYTMAENKRDELTRINRSDPRVKDYNGTAFGALQTFNTYQHWSGIVRNATGGRTERNIEREVNGKIDSLDQGIMDNISKVLENA